MDFSYSEEQTLLRDSIARYLADNYDYEKWKKFVTGEDGRDPRHWRQFAELGLLAASLPEAYDGLGGGALDCAIVMEEFGKRLVVEPYVPTIVVLGGLLARAGSEDQKKEYLPRIASGGLIAALAISEPKSRYNLADVTVSAKKQGSGYVLSGQKSVVFGAPFADTLLVTARTAGGPRDEKGVSLFLVDKKMRGVSCRDFPMVDGNRASEIVFENVEVPASALIGPADGGLALFDRSIDEAIAAHCNEAVGVMRNLLDMTVAYSKQRKQFGQPIGKFQALQHRMADMFVNLEQSVSMALVATLNLDTGPTERRKAVSAAKVRINNALRFVGQQAIQIHGGMGMTEEMEVSHFYERATVLIALYGDTDYHLRRFVPIAVK